MQCLVKRIKSKCTDENALRCVDIDDNNDEDDVVLVMRFLRPSFPNRHSPKFQNAPESF